MILQKIQQELSKEKYSKNILVRITQIWQNNSSKRTCEKNKFKIISQLSPRNFNMADICISYSKKNNILTVLKKTEEKKIRKIPGI
jgi:hypothetical protein